MTEKTYNGWTNYETWNVALWMDNDEGSQAMWAERAQAVYEAAEADGTFTKEEQAVLDLSEIIKDQYEERSQEILKGASVECSVWADLLGAALSEVNWHEIAEHLIGDCEKEENGAEAEAKN